jgi:hypothetical protein
VPDVFPDRRFATPNINFFSGFDKIQKRYGSRNLFQIGVPTKTCHGINCFLKERCVIGR